MVCVIVIVTVTVTHTVTVIINAITLWLEYDARCRPFSAMQGLGMDVTHWHWHWHTGTGTGDPYCPCDCLDDVSMNRSARRWKREIDLCVSCANVSRIRQAVICIVTSYSGTQCGQQIALQHWQLHRSRVRGRDAAVGVMIVSLLPVRIVTYSQSASCRHVDYITASTHESASLRASKRAGCQKQRRDVRLAVPDINVIKLDNIFSQWNSSVSRS